MNDIIQQIRSAYGENPESALKLLPELFKQYGEKLISVVPCKEFYSKTGDTAFLIEDGEIIEVVYGGAKIDFKGELKATIIADDEIFPYREPDAERDMDPTDWCTNTEEIGVE